MDVRFLHWNGAYWEQDNGEETQAYAKVRGTARFFETDYAQKFSDDKTRRKWTGWSIHIGNDNRIRAMLKYIRKERAINVPAHTFENQPYFINVTNGTLDLRDGTLGTYTKDDHLTQQLPWRYEPEAACPMWMQFLDLVTHGNQEFREYLQRIAGYALTGCTDAQVFFYFYGQGGTGKSTFLETIRTMVGGYGMYTDIKTFAFGPDGPKEIAKMPGKRYVYGGDVQKTTKLDIGLIKNFTGGEEISGRRPYQEGMTFRPQGKLFFASNHELRADATDTGFWRRVHMIPFRVTIPSRDYIPKTVAV